MVWKYNVIHLLSTVQACVKECTWAPCYNNIQEEKKSIVSESKSQRTLMDLQLTEACNWNK